ncbi:SET and MYND domain-containing protein DDB_G0273589-like [Chironomus tepperi]|uniref:SET and MYND domain-containing protein DDB_G0273589-like n=1 Tax=Chironomus tepperi TaxID=113505 RepID=UPI00391FB5F6
MCDEVFHVPLNRKKKAIAKNASKLGKKYFMKQNNFVALILFNQLISNAKTRNDLSYGYVYRSAVYYALKMYDECLQNIKLSRENGYPEDVWPQINDREEKCKLMLEEPRKEKCDPWKIFKLSYPPNKKVPWIADCVEVWTTEKYGRGIYATRDLVPGDIISIEDIIVNYSCINYEYTHCFNCYKANGLNLIHCDISGHMMFCSPACRDDVYCKAINIDTIVSADVKILSDIAKAFGDLKKFDDFMLNTDLTDLNKTIFDFDFSNPNDPDYQKNLMICFLSLSANDHDQDFGHCSDIFNYVSKKAAQRIIDVFRLNRRMSYILVNKNEYLEVGCHVSLFASLANHSCLSNAYTVLVDNKIATVIQHPVKAGEQIFLNYTFDSASSQDLDYIQEVGMFQCDCNFCIKNKRLNMCLKKKITRAINIDEIDMFPVDDLTDYDKIKKYLDEKWKACKNLQPRHQYYSFKVLYPLAMLDYIAGNCAYPFSV